MSQFRALLCLVLFALMLGTVGRFDHDDAVLMADTGSADPPAGARPTQPLRLACRALETPSPQPALVSAANLGHPEPLADVRRLECVVVP